MTPQRPVNFSSLEYLQPIETYVPGLRIDAVTARFGVPAERVVKLGSGENPLGPSPKAVAAIKLALKDLALYPDWRSEVLREAIARHNALPREQVLVGSGETELFSLIVRAFSEQAEAVLFPLPTFPIYAQAALVERRQAVPVAADRLLQFDPEKLVHAVTAKTKIIFLTSPNNPLSTVIEREAIQYILDQVDSEVLVLLDEAYVDYSESGTQLDLLGRYPNLIILRTFSKIYGLAGLRVGYAMAQAAIVQALMKLKPTWNIGNLASAGAAAALEDQEHYQKTRQLVQAGRQYLIGRLSEFTNLAVIMKPQANFLCLRIREGDISSTDLFEGLLQGGIITKDCSVSFQGLGDRCIRVDVSVKPKMDRFLERLATLIT
ncbi:MAG: histidinol-phosphate transaminase [Desulfobacterales bacterium]|nr:MAG: histidinol-phosphate transaminase [Desulfobacterales bacterium]